MKITLKDFGPISHFEFDLEKDMHVIFGKNNVGKSYASTAIYLILKHICHATDYFSAGVFAHANSDIISYDEKKILHSITTQTNITQNISNTFRSVLHFFFQKAGRSFNNSFPAFSQLSNRYSENDTFIVIHCREFTIRVGLNAMLNAIYVKDVVLNFPIIVENVTNDKQLFLINDTVEDYGFSNRILSFSKIIEEIYTCFENAVSNEISSVYFLPASRSGLYQGLNAFSAIIAELSKNRNLIAGNKIELPALSEPVSDYFLSLSNIDSTQKGVFSDEIRNLEKQILNGEILFNNETKKITFKENGHNEQLDLSFSSSMVSELAPIVAYFKYIVWNEKEHNHAVLFKKPSKTLSLLFIEEPEAHLHPEVQVKLMEMFALLAGNGVKIVMTSHSNYMFNKLSNLLLEGKVDHNKVSSYLMRMTDKGSVTDMLSMKAEADGMNDENFADVAEMLYEERIKIYDKLNGK